MSTGKTIFFTVLLGALVVGAMLGIHEWQTREDAAALGPAMTSSPSRNTLPDFSLPDLDARLHRSGEWLGKVLVLNFWATWCPPCRKEMPVFITLQNEFGDKGLQFVGIAIDEKSKVREFVDFLGVNYLILLGENDAVQLSRDLGNRFRGLPFTVIFDRTGRVSHIQAGELQRSALEAQIKPLL
jgi:thiol-disulfide isomerase/thioredoxin